MTRSVILDAADAQRLLLGCRGTCAVVDVCLARYCQSGDARWALAFSPPSMCARHTRCRIVRVRWKSQAELLSPTERRRRADAGIGGPLPQDLK